ncbi:hypothetical protein DPEC_G00086710 [Dallia pectoralis]|uniref:Uncharacterized protein n=1 Tax=Dallia pectoralis TaxID=75939 RepID=A0ACC2H029_DALPE|nr:hypothetical protein DPEC_G00086710 [Dallia pectoralis]
MRKIYISGEAFGCIGPVRIGAEVPRQGAAAELRYRRAVRGHVWQIAFQMVLPCGVGPMLLRERMRSQHNMNSNGHLNELEALDIRDPAVVFF